MIRPGQWGGRGIGMKVAEGGATFEFDCAHGKVTRAITLEQNGRFEVVGSHEEEVGGPVKRGVAARDEEGNVRSDDVVSGRSRQARYTGEIRGPSMTLTVTLVGSDRPLGAFHLTYAAVPLLTKCR